MADPKLYLPPVLSEDAIRKLLADLQLPEPTTVEPMRTTAAFHTLYLIDFSAVSASKLELDQPKNADGSTSLILRVSGKHLPNIKTTNEVATMKWVKERSNIPIPGIVRYDASEENSIHHEFTLLEKVLGVSVDSIYDELDEPRKEKLVAQLAGYLIELRAHGWNHAGGLDLDQNGEVVPGRLVAETFWQAPEIAEIWDAGESVDSLNARGPFDNYSTYVQGHITNYIRNIETHSTLGWMRDLIPRLETFISFLDRRSEMLNDTRYILTQRDLHFGNVMCDPKTARITAILDWEFSAVLPTALWNPGKAFLWNGQETPEGMAEQERLYETFVRICQERDPDLLSDFDVKTQHPHQEILRILNYVRAIVEVCPRGQKASAARDWRKTAEEALSQLGL